MVGLIVIGCRWSDNGKFRHGRAGIFCRDAGIQIMSGWPLYNAIDVYVDTQRKEDVISALVLFLAVFDTAAMDWPASVDHAADGDTLAVYRKADSQKFRVRLWGID